MNTAFRSTLLAGALVFAAFGTAAHAADEDVVAKVGSEKITERDLKAAAAEVGEQFARLPADQRKLAVLSALIDIKALAHQAEKAERCRTTRRSPRRSTSCASARCTTPISPATASPTSPRTS